MNFLLEVIGFTIESCLIAQAAGAHRIELCDNPVDGGTTPSYGFIKTAREKLDIKLYPIIRPRGGDFLYSDAEFEVMKADIRACRELKCDGVVIGMLLPDGTVDMERCKELIKAAAPMGITFHRAFDRVADAGKSLKQIIELGCERILTSGLQPTVTEGIETISALIKQAAGRIIIMPGSGIRAENIIDIAQKTGAVEFHTSARIQKESKMKYVNENMKENLCSVTVNENEVKDMVHSLTAYFTNHNKRK